MVGGGWWMEVWGKVVGELMGGGQRVEGGGSQGEGCWWEEKGR